MAHPNQRLPGNAEGDFYVDDTCIDCDTCRWLAPKTFFRTAGQSAVKRQPDTTEARRQALLAVTACPTASIGTDHPFWRERFGCERILHEGDLTSTTRDVERILTGTSAIALMPELLIIPIPGHTKGSCALLYRDSFLFTGDHLAWSERRGHLYAFRDACWHSWPQTVASMEKLRDYHFEWVLPGHGRRFHADRKTMEMQLETCIRWMRGSD